MITGASSGIGAEIARGLAARGHAVMLVARRRERLERIASDLTAEYGVEAIPVSVDLAEPSSVTTLAMAVDATGLRLRYLVNCAGFNLPAPAEELSWEAHERLFQVSVLAPIKLILALLPRLRRDGPGRILNVASLAALRPGCLNVASYSASKTALLRFSESLAAELEGSGVTVTVSCPGLVATEFFNSFVAPGDMAAFMARQGRFMMTAQAVAREAIEAAEAGRLVHVHGFLNRISATLFKHLPGGMGRRLANMIVRKTVTSEVTMATVPRT